MPEFHYYEPSLGHGLPRDPLKAIVGPRPIGWISSVSATGVNNLAPYSFFNLFNSDPPIIGFSTIGWKDSIDNIAATGVFGWSLATRPLAEAMNKSSQIVPPDTDEFELAGLTAAPSRLIAAARVAESPASFECRLSQLLQIETAAGEKVPTWLVLGEVVAVHIDLACLDSGLFQTAAARPILRAGGATQYAEISEDAMFSLERPGTPLV